MNENSAPNAAWDDEGPPRLHLDGTCGDTTGGWGAHDGPSRARIPPRDLDAEAAALSAILPERDALDRVIDILRHHHPLHDLSR